MKTVLKLLAKGLGVTAICFAFYFFNNDKPIINNSLAVEYNTVPYEVVNHQPLGILYGQLTGYGPDCRGCSGITAAGHDVRDGNIYFTDKQYGRIRIIAADRKFRFGTIMKITAKNLYDEPFIAIVLDRGGLIKNNVFDLLFEKEEGLRTIIGRQHNVKYEILRYGWK